MKVKIIKPIKVSEVGKTVLPKDHECEVSDSTAKILIKKGYAEEVKASQKKEEKKDVKASDQAKK